ncbi:MAG TPA: hypothetical protein PKJ84_11215 [Anaerolineales bacterium]|nr:hypothetical protein [Anaerolineales bacterium]
MMLRLSPVRRRFSHPRLVRHLTLTPLLIMKHLLGSHNRTAIRQLLKHQIADFAANSLNDWVFLDLCHCIPPWRSFRSTFDIRPYFL